MVVYINHHLHHILITIFIPFKDFISVNTDFSTHLLYHGQRKRIKINTLVRHVDVVTNKENKHLKIVINIYYYS